MDYVKVSILQEQHRTTLYLQEPFFDQVEHIPREEVYINLEHESLIQIKDDDSDGDVQESELGYESSNASEVRDYTSTEWVEYWKCRLPNSGELLEDDSEEKDVLSYVEDESLFSEEDTKLEVLHYNLLCIEAGFEQELEDELSNEEDVELQFIYHNPLFIEGDVPKEEESSLVPCDDKDVEESRTFSPPTPMEIHHELPKVN